MPDPIVLNTGQTIDPLLTAEEVAAYLRITRTTLYRWAAAGKGPASILIGTDRRWRLSVIEDYLNAQAA